MALLLDPILLAAQNGNSQRPLVSIVSDSAFSAFPLPEQLLTDATFVETRPAVLAHSSGRLVTAYLFTNGNNRGVNLAITDSGRTVFAFTSHTLYTNTNYAMQSVSVVELANGNVGLTILVNDSASHLFRLLYKIVTPTGVAVSNGEISTWSHDTATSLESCIKLTDSTFLLVYAYATAGNWSFYKRSSSDFSTWSAATAVTIAGITATKRLGNPCLAQIDSGAIHLAFDLLEDTGSGGEELTNIYQAISLDNGVAWGSALQRTFYTTYGTVALDPSLMQLGADTLELAYTDQSAGLKMTSTAVGWGDPDDAVKAVKIDEVNRTAYVICGNYMVSNVVKVNLDTWQVLQNWTASSVPALPFSLSGSTAYSTTVIKDPPSTGNIIVMCCQNGANFRGFVVLDGEANTMREVQFSDYLPANIVANCTGVPAFDQSGGIAVTHYDPATDRVYLIFVNGYLWSRHIVFGYVAMAGGAPYQFTLLWHKTPPSGYSAIAPWYFPTEDVIVVSDYNEFGPGLGNGEQLKVFTASTGVELYTTDYYTNVKFPIKGLRGKIHYQDGIIYGGFTYDAGYGQADQRGLCIIDTRTDAISFSRPPFASVDDYQIWEVIAGKPGQLLVRMYVESLYNVGYGVGVYTIATRSWELFNVDNVPGSFDANNGFTYLAYDRGAEMIITGRGYYYGPHGISYFSTYGSLQQLRLATGTYSGGTWTFAAPTALTQGRQDLQLSMTPGPDGGAYYFWDAQDPTKTEHSISWGYAGAGLELATYLVDDTPITITRAIDGSPCSLGFTVSSGHLFDPYHQGSLLAPILKKGRKLTLRLGELVGGTEYWQASGIFYVSEGSLSLSRGVYPDMQIVARDQREQWWDSHVIATDPYNHYPEDISISLLMEVANMAVADIDLPAFPNRIKIDSQWLDTDLGTILGQLCHRFEMFFTMGQDGKATARRISDSNAVDHAYTDLKALIEFSPDDRYSDYTNQVTVIGQERDFITVLFPEEQVGTLAGSCGWWGFKKDFTIWWSDDRTKRVQRPRLVVNETAQSIAFSIAGGITESIADSQHDTDYQDKYCTITVDAPDLRAALVAAIGSWFIGHNFPDILNLYTETTISWGRRIEAASMFVAMNILGSIGNFQYEVWGQPVGEVRRQVSAEYNDLAHQVELSRVVAQRLEDPLCYSAGDCQQVANFEGLLRRLERRRVVVRKVTHLQDEEGDTITVLHPISGHSVTIFITRITRTVTKGKTGGSFDTIEGWLL